jgi:hypothetical protein
VSVSVCQCLSVSGSLAVFNTIQEYLGVVDSVLYSFVVFNTFQECLVVLDSVLHSFVVFNTIPECPAVLTVSCIVLKCSTLFRSV